MPTLCSFHTLSPIPKFREWLDLKFASFSNQNEFFNLAQALTQEETSLLIENFNLKSDNKSELFNRIKTAINSQNKIPPKYLLPKIQEFTIFLSS